MSALRRLYCGWRGHRLAERVGGYQDRACARCATYLSASERKRARR